ncbi:hypothetical protein NliqN6_1857 [Naganishia liquefaciens]|uniref:DASH complex subunit DAD3 n=1 Tax=Naganishia liquefaciens TaxID=104408 RepID=A0A8H3TRU0_9TREE|nr:hypothetical protein NliqN6_1857 [Naganishia liquefaciens]
MSDDSIYTVNPYLDHPQLASPLEGEVLWEYAKLARTIRRVDSFAKTTSTQPNDALLAELRSLERKMGLVLTLFKASVWAMITDTEAEAEAEAEEERRRLNEL